MENKRKTGKKYEDIAVQYLIQNGYRIIEQNFYTHYGEVDIIGENEGFLAFIEVKYRKSEKYGSPFEAVNSRKIKNIRNSARYYIYSKGISQMKPVRFDVIAILGDNIELIKNAF